MAAYGKQYFDQCLVAIVSELARAEEQYPDWPDDPVNAATLVSEKAEQLLLASIDHSRGAADKRKQILREATQTGAMILRLLLSMDDRFTYAYDTGDGEWWLDDQKFP